MERNDTGSAARKASVSGSSSQMTATPDRPASTSVRNTDCQPKAVCRMPPPIGASTGASAITEPISDISRPARAPE